MMQRAAEWAKNGSAKRALLNEKNLARALTEQRSRRAKLDEVKEVFGISCPTYNYTLGAGFPRCGHPLMATCRACQKMVSPGWKFSPYCRQDFLKSVSGPSFA